MPLSTILLLLAAQGTSPAQATVPSDSSPRTTILDMDRPQVAEQKWAICIGAGEYKDLAPLKYAAADARLFARTLVDDYGFDPSTVSVIADGAPPTTKPTAANSTAAKPIVPTSASILGEVKRRLADRRLDRGDLFVFYFSGHGIGTSNGDFLMPTDVPEAEAETKGIAVKTLIDGFVGAGLKNVLVIADACRAGQKNPFGNELQILGRKANIAILLGCAPGQRSYEYPRLEHGVFTHFLVRSMKDRGLTDPASGALWASAVAGRVATNVQEYTEADYGAEAQIPAVWGDASQDVLFAAFPRPAETSSAGSGSNLDATLKAQSGKLTRDQYGRYLSGLGKEFIRTGRPLEAIQTLKALDGLGLANWRDLAMLAGGLRDQGREKEIGLLTARAAREAKPTDLSEAIVLYGRPDYVGPERFRQAALATTRAETYGFRGAALRAHLFRNNLRADDALTAKALAPFVPLFPPDSMESRFVGANIALGERRYPDAISLAEATAAMPASKPYASGLRQIRYRAATAAMDAPKVEAIIREGMADPTDRYPWTMTWLGRLRAKKDPGFLAAAQARAHTTDSEAELGQLLVLLGADAATVREDALRLVAKHPYAWKGYVNVWVTDAVEKDFRRVPILPGDAFNRAPDPSDVVQYALGQWDEVLQSGIASGKVKAETAWVLRHQLIGAYARYWHFVRDDPVALARMGLAFTKSMQPVRGSAFARGDLWPFAKTQTYVRTELMITCLLLALNGADEPLAREIFATLEAEGRLNAMTISRYAIHQSLVGDATETERAIGLWTKLGVGDPPDGIRGGFEIARAYLALGKGDVPGATAHLRAVKSYPGDAEILMRLLGYAILGKTERTRFVDLLIKPAPTVADVQTAAIVWAVRDAVKTRGPGLATTPTASLGSTEILSYLMAQRAGHPWIQNLGFGGAQGVERWAGETDWAGSITDGMTRYECVMKLRVSATGAASGVVKLSGDDPYPFEGTVDEFGNLTAKIRDGNQGAFIPEEYRANPPRPFATFRMKLPTTTAAMNKELQELGRFYGSILNSAHDGSVVAVSIKSAQPLTEAR